MGGDVNLRDDDGDTPFSVASVNEHLDTMRLLYKLGARTDCRDESGFTPLLTVGTHSCMPEQRSATVDAMHPCA